MILLDTDVMIDLLRQYPPAVAWFSALDEQEEVALPGYVVMELLQGCRNKDEEEHLQRVVAPYGVVWPMPADCDRALGIFAQYHLSHAVGLLDVLIAQTAMTLDTPLCTFNQRHYQFIPGLHTVQPYGKLSSTDDSSE